MKQHGFFLRSRNVTFQKESFLYDCWFSTLHYSCSKAVKTIFADSDISSMDESSVEQYI